MGSKSKSLIIVLICVLLGIFLLSTKPALGSIPEEGTWVRVSTYPTYSGVDGVVALDGKIYVDQQNSFERYDPMTNTWAELTPSPILNPWGTIVACQSKIYLIGGGQPTQVYDPATNQWENKTAIPKTLMWQRAIACEGKIYVISGLNPAPLSVWYPSEETYVYDPSTDSWSTMASIPTPVAGYASAVLDSKIYIIGGGPAFTDYHNITSTSIVQIFDPATNQWTLGKPLPKNVFGASAAITSGIYAPKRIYVVGGSPSFNPNGRAGAGSSPMPIPNQVYDFQTDNWSLLSNAPEIVTEPNLVSVNDVIYAFCTLSIERCIPTGYTDNVPLPSPSVPEFSYLAIILPILLTAPIALAIVRKRLQRNV
jgi:N-acetylneuraminic acid mutarotase